MNEVMEFANSPSMWAFAFGFMVIVIVQAFMIYQTTKKYALSNQIVTKQEIRGALKSGGIAALGPALAVFVFAMSMVNLLGGPMTLMRDGIIGSASTELVTANISTTFAGVSLGEDPMTYKAYGTALFGAAMQSSGYLLIVPLLNRGLAKPLQKIFVPEEGQKPGKLAFFLGVVFPLIIFFVFAGIEFTKGGDHVVVMFVGAILMLVMNTLANRKNIRWLKEWAMGIAVLGAMLCGPICIALMK